MELESANYKYISDKSSCELRRRRRRRRSGLNNIIPATGDCEYSGVPFRWEESPGRPIIMDKKKILQLDQKDSESNPHINHMNLWTNADSNSAALNLPPKLQYQLYNCYHNYYNSQSLYHSDLIPRHLDSNLFRPQILDESELNHSQLDHRLIMSPRSNMLERSLKNHSSKISGLWQSQIKCSGHKFHQNILQIPLNPSHHRINGIDGYKGHGVYHDRFFFNGKLSTSLDMKLMRCFHVSSILDSWNLINGTHNDHNHDHDHDVSINYSGESNLQYNHHHGQLESSLLMMDRDDDDDDDQYAPPSPWILGFSPNISSNTNHHDNLSCINLMGMMKKNKNKIKIKEKKNQMLTNHHSYMKITNKVLRLATLVKMKSSMLGKLIDSKGRMKSSSPWYGQGHDHNNIWSPTLATYLYNQQKELLTTFKGRVPEESKVSKSNGEPHTRCGKNLGYVKSSLDTNEGHTLGPSSRHRLLKSPSRDIEVAISKSRAETKPSNGDPTHGNPLHQSPESVVTKSKINDIGNEAKPPKKCETPQRTMDIIDDIETHGNVSKGEHNIHGWKSNMSQARAQYSNLANNPNYNFSLGAGDSHRLENAADESKSGTQTLVNNNDANEHQYCLPLTLRHGERLIPKDNSESDGPSDNIMATRGDLKNITTSQKETRNTVKEYYG